MYHIAGKFGGNCIWRNGFQAAKNKYWWNFNLAIGNCAYRFLLRHCVFISSIWLLIRKSARGSIKVQRPSRSHGRVSTIKLCSRPSQNAWTPLLGEVLQCKIESGNVQDRYALVFQRKHAVVGHVPSKYRQLAHYSSKEPEESAVRLLKLGIFHWIYLKED